MDPSTKKNRILVVDDEKGLVKLIRLNLEQDGFEVVEANNGAEAMEKLRVTLPDLVLLDVMMPDMDGFQVLKMIREIGNTPVIMLTAKGEESDIVRGLELGADDYITKPFSPKILTSRIRAVLRRGSYADETDTGKIDVDGRLQIDFDRH
ncbi:MAG TPA: response regulator, partial [Anaerolineaceae bacterium]|nr:response regulator [Anaerolineaceae bacterium]